VDDKDVPRNYTDYFPNVSLSFDDQENHSLSINVGRRITRPNYQDLNPFERPTSQLVVWKGNPFLNPNYIMNYQASYSFKNQLILTTTYSETTGFFARIVEITGDQSTQIIPRNMEKATLLGLSASYQFEPFSFWDVLITGNFSRQSFKGDVESTVIDLQNTLWNYRIQNTLKLPWHLLADVTFTQQGRWIWRGSVFIEGTEGLSFGIRKNFLNKKLQLRITGADILRTESDYPYNSNYGGIDLEGVYSADNRRFGMGLTYNFGGEKSENSRRKSGLDEELDRIEN
jgi:iron complex outermembrane receptor protein